MVMNPASTSESKSAWRSSIMVWVVVIGLTSIHAGYALADCLDQVQGEVGAGAFACQGTIFSAQTFTVGTSGQLDRIEVLVDVVGEPAGPLYIELWQTEGDLSDGTGIATLSSIIIQRDEVDGVNFLVLEVVDDDVFVSEGDVLAIVLSSPDSQNDLNVDYYAWKGGYDIGYPGGEAMFYVFGSWQLYTNASGSGGDSVFKTYMVCSTPTEDSTWSNMKALFR